MLRVSGNVTYFKLETNVDDSNNQLHFIFCASLYDQSNLLMDIDQTAQRIGGGGWMEDKLGNVQDWVAGLNLV